MIRCDSLYLDFGFTHKQNISTVNRVIATFPPPLTESEVI